MARLLTLRTPWMMDVAGTKAAEADIAMIRVVAPGMATQLIDGVMQLHDADGMSDDFPLAYAYAGARAALHRRGAPQRDREDRAGEVRETIAPSQRASPPCR